jgi:hypothetical protein
MRDDITSDLENKDDDRRLMHTDRLRPKISSIYHHVSLNPSNTSYFHRCPRHQFECVAIIKRPPSMYEKGTTFLNDAECISLREKLENGESPSSFPEAALQHLYSHLREYELEQRSLEQYKTAKLAKEFSEQIKSEIINRARRHPAPSRLVPCDRRAECQASCEEESQKFDRETTLKRESMLKRHSQILDRFDLLWSSTMPHQYRKASHQLIELKQAEQKLALVGEYDRALEVHEEADHRRTLEQTLAQEKLVEDYRRRRAAVAVKLTREVELFESVRAGTKKVLEARHLTQMNAIINHDLVQQKKPMETSRMRMLSDPGVMRVHLNCERSPEREVLLPPLRRPTDPSIAQKEEERRKAAAKQARILCKRREDEQHAKMEMLEKFQREMQAQKAAQKPPRMQTFVTATDDVPMKIEGAKAAEDAETPPSVQPAAEVAGESASEPSQTESPAPL